MSIQKSLVRTMNASLIILSEIQSGDFSVKHIAQKTADIAANWVKPQMNYLGNKQTNSVHENSYKQ